MLFVCLIFGVISIAYGDVPELDGKIVGGFDVTIEQFPYQVSVQLLQSHICGGAIIHPRYILTAAHCTNGSPAYLMQVRVGSSAHAHGGRIISVAVIHQHPAYNPQDVNCDLSILQLEDAIQYGLASRNVQLPYYGFEPRDGAHSVVSGWGFSREGGSVSNTLQAVFLPIVNKERCRQSYPQYALTHYMFCAGIIDVGMKDTCQGDSGGPLVHEGMIIGIVSWGYGCARPKYPGVYTDVAKLRSFIDRTIRF